LRIGIFGLRGLRPDLEITGFETAFSEIAPRLVQRGHSVTIFGRAGAHSRGRRPAMEDGVRLLYVPSPGGKSLSALASTSLAVTRALATERFDVWFFVNVGMGHHAALARLSGAPVVMNVDGLDWQRGKWGRIAKWYFRSAARSAVRWCTELVTDAEAMRTFYQDEMGRDSTMIPYGADQRYARHPERLRTLGLQPNEYYLIVSRLIPENTLAELIEGFSQSGTKRRLAVVGSANYRDDFIEALRLRASADSRIQFLGHVADQTLLDELWCNCYAYLHGHSVGGTNPALLRAMGCGAAVLARDTVFNREVLQSGARFFAPQPTAIARAINEVDALPADVAQLRERSRRRVAERYTWESVVEDYERLFTSVTVANDGRARADGARR
jgi:glycosyltransferase involved in cell wall biosynthesis